jgi:hypothetical protein
VGTWLYNRPPADRRGGDRRAHVRPRPGAAPGIGGNTAERGGRKPWIAGLDVRPRAAGAVALERAPGELCCWDWGV